MYINKIWKTITRKTIDKEDKNKNEEKNTMKEKFTHRKDLPFSALAGKSRERHISEYYPVECLINLFFLCCRVIFQRRIESTTLDL